jgi:hypothetical protein
MKRLVPAFLVVIVCGCSNAQVPQPQQKPEGRYFTPTSLLALMKTPDGEKTAQTYLMGAYDVAQDAGRSCAQRGTTTPVLLEKVFTDYVQAHPGVKDQDRTAASVASQAFGEYWPCQKQ